MSPVFRHGRLRLYLLKLLDDAPKHGYEVIRLLQDRFMGVYAPSPGTIYPRLARLEEEGLVTHDEVEGRKVYRLTDKGREEIRERVDDLAELEEEITESVRDIAREVKEDVRETVRSLREEIARAARDVRREGGQAQSRPADGPDAKGEGSDEDLARQRAQWERDRAAWERERAEWERERGHGERGPKDRGPREHGSREHGEARRQRGGGRGDTWRDATDWEEQAAGGGRPHDERERAGEEASARFRAGRGRSRRDWGDWSALRDWAGWREWSGLKDWRDWPGSKDWTGSRDWSGPGRVPGWPDAAKLRDLERVALQFATELRRLATHAGAIGEDTLGDLRTILDEALSRIRTEVLRPDDASAEEKNTATPEPDDASANNTGAPEEAEDRPEA
jgi:DNA-binding PadR family transcriptional regulator